MNLKYLVLSTGMIFFFVTGSWGDKSELSNYGKTWSFLKKALQSFKGDFNGDGTQDVLYVVNTGEIPAEALKAATLKAAWPYYGDEKVIPGLKNGGPKALVIAEKYRDSYKFYIIYDPNSISVLSAPAAEGLFVVARSDKKNPAWKEIGKRAKGDVIIIPTEAGIDSYFFRGDASYQSLEILEEP